MNKKKAVFFVAENHAGKTSVANRLVDLYYPRMVHLSIRGIIKTMHKTLYDSAVFEDRDVIQNFSEMQKAEYGPEIFIEEAVRQFNDSVHDFAIIESVRAPGEAVWIRETLNKTFPNITPLIIGLTAPFNDRYNRFLSERPDNLSRELTRIEFDRQEDLVNNGMELWEENIETTMLLTDSDVSNYDNKLPEALYSIQELISKMKSAN